jgi:magnesium transporter
VSGESAAAAVTAARSPPVRPAAAEWEPERRDSALAHATDRVPTARPGDTATAVRAGLSGASFAFAGVVVLLDDERTLVGVVPLERILAAPPSTRLADLADRGAPVVAPDAEQEAVAQAGAEHGGAVAIVDERGRFLAIVPPAAMLRVLRAEHEEDLARLGGYLAGTRRARDAAEESVRRRLVHRLPWLLLGLVGAMASAVIVGAFEHQLDARVLLAFFVPGVVYMADAVGTQTEAILIRGLSVGVSMRDVIRREAVTGLIVGSAVGATFAAFAALVWGDAEVAAAVGLALVASCSIASLVAMVLPWTFQRLGCDPAFGSGPLATVVQDLLSIAVYFAIAALLVA